MWLQVVGVPDALHRTEAGADNPGHRAAGPVGDLARRLGAGKRQDPGQCLGRGRRPARWTRPVRGRASTPASASRACHRQGAGRLTQAWRITSATGSLSADSRTIRARWTCLRGRCLSAAIEASRLRSPSPTTRQMFWAIRLPCHAQPSRCHPSASVHQADVDDCFRRSCRSCSAGLAGLTPADDPARTGGRQGMPPASGRPDPRTRSRI